MEQKNTSISSSSDTNLSDSNKSEKTALMMTFSLTSSEGLLHYEKRRTEDVNYDEERLKNKVSQHPDKPFRMKRTACVG